MSMQLRCGITVHRSRTIMLEARRDPFARCFRRMVSSNPGLDILLHFAERHLHALAMCAARGFVSTNERSQGDALRSRERRVPGGTVLNGANRLTSRIDVFARCLMANQLL